MQNRATNDGDNGDDDTGTNVHYQHLDDRYLLRGMSPAKRLATTRPSRCYITRAHIAHSVTQESSLSTAKKKTHTKNPTSKPEQYDTQDARRQDKASHDNMQPQHLRKSSQSEGEVGGILATNASARAIILDTQRESEAAAQMELEERAAGAESREDGGDAAMGGMPETGVDLICSGDGCADGMGGVGEHNTASDVETGPPPVHEGLALVGETLPVEGGDGGAFEGGIATDERAVCSDAGGTDAVVKAAEGSMLLLC